LNKFVGDNIANLALIKLSHPFLTATSEDKSPLISGTLKYFLGSNLISSSILEGSKSLNLLSLILRRANLRKSLSSGVKSLVSSQGFKNNKSSYSSLSYISLYKDST
jgi:hypothetical protein